MVAPRSELDSLGSLETSPTEAWAPLLTLSCRLTAGMLPSHSSVHGQGTSLTPASTGTFLTFLSSIAPVPGQIWSSIHSGPPNVFTSATAPAPTLSAPAKSNPGDSAKENQTLDSGARGPVYSSRPASLKHPSLHQLKGTTIMP